MSKSFRIYKPNKQGTGAATEWQLSRKDTKYNNVMFFLVGAAQDGKDENDNSKFSWQDKSRSVTMKMGEFDIGEILSVLNGLKNSAGTDKGIFHKNEKGNTILSFSKYFRKDEKSGEEVFIGYALRLSKKQNDGGTAFQVQHLLTFSEGEVLRVLLGEALKEIYGWSNTPNTKNTSQD